MWKGPRVTTGQRRKRKYRELSLAERNAKSLVHDRDKLCRFPLCGCHSGGYSMKDILTVSHDVHKGMGGDPSGERSQPELMLLLCKWRHQDGPVSRHRGTMRTVYLTEQKNDGPLAFEVDLWALYPGMHERPGTWVEVARELDVRRMGPLSAEQQLLLDELQEMER